jgi:glycosyltransferase A (GT-A) superfamily protein (DUF2064 family)
MTSEEVMQLIQGDTPMSTEKIENVLVSRSDLEDLLALYNCLDSMTDEVSETFDLDLSTLRNVQTLSYKLKARFDFRPQADDVGDRPCHWKPYVLPDDERAWFYKGEND